ncbi:hypothetical protein [Thiomicrorhabdus sediminis]|uniref:Uncharacterized protein n=1 Tax=Thiomicrorhabdus sediminis TaxID=2580412 RepID=A0A4P9K6P5_9GAMM|nr:hypothetical protein [Thiomicrorhabdus sediminis]QCU90541.1 hypothetical protein FE785_07795 [Thiomicrorhabdus sediminis]
MKQIKERRRYFRVAGKMHLHFMQSYENINPNKSSFIDFFSDDIEYTAFCFEEFVKNVRIPLMMIFKPY